MMLSLGQQTIRLRGGRSVHASLPSAESLGFVVVHVYWPIPWHVNYFEDGTELVLVRPCRTIWFPEERPLHVSVGSPCPAVITPIFLVAVTTRLDELVKLSVGDHELTGLEVWDIQVTLAVLVVPSKRREVSRLAKVYGSLINRNHSILWIVHAFNWVGRGSLSICRWVERGPVFGRLDQMVRCLTEKHRTCLQVNSLMLVAHEKSPHGM
mmetsp:Transcript_5965/g.14128  ORF Transcript_5965/g.14128 Transcript_5965/m.14128 type:complete len:210 (-) Transcript_5965:267-896(-)